MDPEEISLKKEINEQLEEIDSLNLNTLAGVCGQQEELLGWRDLDRTFGEECSLFHSEISEALECYRDGYTPLKVLFTDGKLEGIPIELADLVIRVLAYCDRQDMNIMGAIRLKLAHNLTRDVRHGGKTL